MKRIDIIDNNKEYIKYLKSKIKNQKSRSNSNDY